MYCFIFSNILRFMIFLFSIPLFIMLFFAPAFNRKGEKGLTSLNRTIIFHKFIGVIFFIGNIYSDFSDTSCTKVIMFNLGILMLNPFIRHFITKGLRISV